MFPESSRSRHSDDTASTLALSLSQHDIHVWCAVLGASVAELRKMESVLSEDELTRAARYCIESARNEFICARAVLRKILSRYLEIPAPDIEFAYGAHGKPAISAYTN